MYIVLDVLNSHGDGELCARSYKFEKHDDFQAYCMMRKKIMEEYVEKNIFKSYIENKHDVIDAFDSFCESYITRFGPEKIPNDIRYLINDIRDNRDQSEKNDFGPLGGNEVPSNMINHFVCDHIIYADEYNSHSKMSIASYRYSQDPPHWEYRYPY